MIEGGCSGPRITKMSCQVAILLCIKMLRCFAGYKYQEANSKQVGCSVSGSFHLSAQTLNMYFLSKAPS